jgi:hypothetical protein
MKHSSTEGLVYYLLDATRLEQRVKIGYTTNLGERLTALASDTLMRQRPIVLALEAGGTELEQRRHDQFRELWVMGEWFEYGPALAEHLRSLPNPMGWLLDNSHLWCYAKGWQGFTGWTKQRIRLEELEQTAQVDTDVPEWAEEVPAPIYF